MNEDNTYVMFVLPKPFIRHFKEDKFEDSFERIKADIRADLENKIYGCSGNYELEVIEMLEVALKHSLILRTKERSNNDTL